MVVLNRRTVVRGDRFAPSAPLRHLPLLAGVLDVVALVSAALIALAVRGWLVEPERVSTRAVVVGAVLLALGTVGALWMRGAYAPVVVDAGIEQLRRVLSACTTAVVIACAACFLLDLPLSRWYFGIDAVLATTGVLLGRLALRGAVRRTRQAGGLLHQVVLVGDLESVCEIAGVLRRESALGYQLVGALVPGERGQRGETACGIPILGNTQQAVQTARLLGVDVLFFADGGVGSAAEMRQVVWQLEHDDVQVVVAPSITDVSNSRLRLLPTGGLPMIHVDPPRASEAVRWGKRAFDIIGATVLLLAAAPLLAIAAVHIRLTDGGPILFRQQRVGRDGVMFDLLKLRTMVVDAEARLARLKAEAGFEHGLFKLEHDPRITAAGRWLRRFSVDELPQLINVLRGDMSLIGPRPPLPSEVATYDADAHRRMRVRPGLTGLWQVSGRSDLSFEEAIRLDLYYVDNWSMLQDLNILMRTVSAVLSSKGAY